jgi:putative tryptophan/tyrosine transport system substrate-binding protein
MRRRDFITALSGAAALTWLFAARAQQPKIPVIGFLNGAAPDAYAARLAAFRKGLADTGFVEDKNVKIEYRWARNQADQLPALAADLVQHQVAVIVTSGGEVAAFAAKQATSMIPIVFLIGENPIKIGLASALNRGSANITGVTFFTAELLAKRMQLLHEVVPKVAVIAMLVNPNSLATESYVRDGQAAAIELGLQLRILRVSSVSDIDAAFASIAEQKIGALLVSADPFFTSNRNRIVELAARYAIPSNYQWREFAEAGGLMSYGASIIDANRQAGIHTGKILKGEKPSDLPIIQPTKFEFVINLKTAKTLDLIVPDGLLNAAEVIE